MSAAKAMGPNARMDNYARQKGWQGEWPQPLMTRPQYRRWWGKYRRWLKLPEGSKKQDT